MRAICPVLRIGDSGLSLFQNPISRFSGETQEGCERSINPSEVGSAETSEYVAYFSQWQCAALVGHDLRWCLQAVLGGRGHRNAKHLFRKNFARQRQKRNGFHRLVSV